MKRMKNKFKKNAHSLIKYNQPKTEIPMSTYKIGGTSVKLPLIA